MANEAIPIPGEPESVVAGRFFLWFDRALERYGLSEADFVKRVLPMIREDRMFDVDVVERAINRYRDRK